MTDLPALPLTYLLRPPVIHPDRLPPLLIMLHGIGSDEGDLFGLASSLDDRLMTVSLRAPLTLPQGGYGWYPLRLTPQGARADVEVAAQNQTLINEFIRAAPTAFGADPARVTLLGFSQGAIMSLNTMLTTPELIAGVVAMSGRILPALQPTWAAPERLKDFPVMVVHGTYDNVLPITEGRAVRDLLTTLPVKLTYREYPMAHQVSEASLRDIDQWLTARLDATAPPLD